jgi:hypothetical protein
MLRRRRALFEAPLRSRRMTWASWHRSPCARRAQRELLSIAESQVSWRARWRADMSCDADMKQKRAGMTSLPLDFAVDASPRSYTDTSDSAPHATAVPHPVNIGSHHIDHSLAKEPSNVFPQSPAYAYASPSAAQPLARGYMDVALRLGAAAILFAYILRKPDCRRR